MAKAVRYHKQGGPEVLQLDEVQVGEPGPGQVRVRHTAIGVNFLDTYQRSGLYPMQLPGTAGNEAAGIVEAVGPDVTELKAGDRIAYTGLTGAYCDVRLVPADRWIEGPERFTLGGVEFQLQPVGPAHTAEDLVVFLPGSRVLFAGDIVFRGRVPFVGQADSGRWVEALDKLVGFDAALIVPGHGPASSSAQADLKLTRDYLLHLRQTMAEAARNLEPFEEAYARADWSRFEHLPLFKAANRINAYNTYLLMEQSAK